MPSARAVVVDRMCDIIKAHAFLLYAIMFAKLLLPNRKQATLFAAFCACVNIVCASERIWSAQAKTIFIWDKWTQNMFILSKYICRVLAVVMLGLWISVMSLEFGVFDKKNQ